MCPGISASKSAVSYAVENSNQVGVMFKYEGWGNQSLILLLQQLFAKWRFNTKKHSKINVCSKTDVFLLFPAQCGWNTGNTTLKIRIPLVFSTKYLPLVQKIEFKHVIGDLCSTLTRKDKHTVLDHSYREVTTCWWPVTWLLHLRWYNPVRAHLVELCKPSVQCLFQLQTRSLFIFFTFPDDAIEQQKLGIKSIT